MQNRILLTIFMILTTCILRAQAPILSWQKCFGGPSYDYGESILPTPDGGYIMVGQTTGSGGDITGFYSINVGSSNGWVVKMDHTGAIQWQECLGGTVAEFATVVLSTSDGGYLVGGSSSSPTGTGNVTSANHGGWDYWVVKLSSTGAIQWQNSYGGSQDEMLYAMSQTTDGGYILAGSSDSDDDEVSGNNGTSDYWVVKITGIGVMQWQKCLGGSDEDFAYGVAQSPDGGYFITGYTNSSDGEVTESHGIPDMWVVKLDANGNLLWQNSLGGSLEDVGNAVAATSDGGCISAGYTYSNDGNVTGNHGRMDIWVVRLNSTGTILWQSCYGGSSYDDAQSIAATPDGGYLLAGGTSSTDGQVTCYNEASGGMGWVVKIDATGALLWEETLGGNVGDAERSIEPTADGGAIVGGLTESTDLPDFHGGQDFYVAKLVLPPSASINKPPGAICAGSSFTFTATVSGALPTGSNYSWNDNGSAAGSGTSYTVANPGNGEQVYCQLVLSTPAGCPDNVNSNVVTIPVEPVPVIAISDVGSGPFCEGTVETFTATVTNGGGSPLYEWEVNGGEAGSGSNTFTISTLNNGDVISCVYSDNTGCAVAPSNTITAQVEPTATSSIVIDASPSAVCQGAAISFTAMATNAGAAPAYQWQVNGVDAGGKTDIFSTQGLVNGDVVSCSVTDSTGCVTPSTANVTAVINPIPVVSTAPPIILSGGQSATLDLPVMGDVASYVWTPATGLSDPDVAEPIATPKTTTTYTLTVTSPAGCIDSGQVVVKVSSTLAIPSAFSPNGDGHNDIFYVIGGPAGSVVKEFAVFGRWGQRIFQAHDTAPDDPAYGWNGTIGGQPAAPGAYVYVILMGFPDGSQQVYKGTVVLVR